MAKEKAPSLVGKTIEFAGVQCDHLGHHINLRFTDKTSATISLLWPEKIRLDIDAAFYPSDGADSVKLKLPKE